MEHGERFRDFVREMTLLVGRAGYDEGAIFQEAVPLVADLVSADDWLPAACAEPQAGAYRQYLLHCDPLERFSVVSFVWGPGVGTPVHDHTVWGVIGMLRGAEVSQSYDRDPVTGRLLEGARTMLEPGMTECVSPTIGDIHVVKNAFEDRPSISIHVYGANLGAVRRHVFDPATGAPSRFVSGFSNTACPNIWDRSKEAAA
ncbi:MAG: cysteine dioxygenase [Alphaproteobacteria bacterium]